MGVANLSSSKNQLLRRKQLQRGFSLIELLIVIAIILVIAAIAIPKMNKQLMAAREAAAISQVKSLTQAELQYNSQFGKFASSLAELGPPASGAASPAAADLIPKNLADGKASGYIFAIQATPGGYAITAVPEQFGSSGTRNFFSDQNGGVHVSFTQDLASDKSPTI